MAVSIIIGVILAMVAIGVGSQILFPVINYAENSDAYKNLSLERKQQFDTIYGMAATTPVVVIGIVFIWAYLRAANRDSF